LIATQAAPMVAVHGLVKVFDDRRGHEVRAVDGVTFDVHAGETFGIVGESGCGKTTLGRCVLRLIEPTAGSVRVDGIDLGELDEDQLRAVRRRIQIVFQDPWSSLDPRMTVRQIVSEGLEIHDVGTESERRARVMEILSLVGLSADQAGRRPHAFSGGQRQRVSLARAMVLEPDLVVLDEPISALDVSVQAQVLNLLRELQQRLSLTYLFIVHDLAVAEHFCDRVAVLYLGSVMEIAEAGELFSRSLHPYTAALLSAVPIPDPTATRRRDRIVLSGEVAQVEGDGCPFQSRCPVGRDREICGTKPPLIEHSAGHWASCHFPGELQAGLT